MKRLQWYMIYKKLVDIIYSKWFSFFFSFSAISLVIFFGLILHSSTVDGQPITFSYWILLMMMIIIFIIIPYCALRWFIFAKRKYTKKIQKRLIYFDKAMELLEKARNYSTTINTTTERDVFEFCLVHLESTFRELIKYEKYAFFINSLPSLDLEEFLDKKKIVIQEFEKRAIADANRIYDEKRNTSINNFDSMNGHEFEHFCAKLLNENGFVNVVVTQGSGDHGTDILAEKDDVSYAIQCKCYSANIGNAAIQQALAGKNFYKKDIAVVLTNQYFTSQAKEEAEVFGVKLWDRDKLTDLIQKLN